MALLTVEPTEFKVDLTEKLTDGLQEFQVFKLEETVRAIRKVDGVSKVFAAKCLWELRGVIKGSKKAVSPKQWTAFKKSGLVPFSSREIQDLCTIHEFVRDEGIEPEMLNTVGIRTLALVATAQPAIRKQLVGKLMTGEQVTRQTIQALTAGKKEKKTDTGWEAFWAGVQPKVKKLSTEQLRDRVESLEKKVYEAERQRKELQARINSMKINPS